MSAQNFDPDWAVHLKHDPDKPLGVGIPEPKQSWEEIFAIQKATVPSSGIGPITHDDERRPKIKGQEHGDQSKSWISVKVKIFGSTESMDISCQTCSTVLEIAEQIAFKCGKDPYGLDFIQKTRLTNRVMYLHEQVARVMIVKGLYSFEKEKANFGTKVIIGAGHLGLRMGMMLLERKDTDFIIFDRMYRVGGTSWMYQANSTSKLQTEFGAYHLAFGEDYPMPTHFTTPWPSRNALLEMFRKDTEEYGVMPHIKLNTNVKAMEVNGKGHWSQVEGYELILEDMEAGRLKYGKLVAAEVEDESKLHPFTAGSISMFPGNLTLPRMETYKGEDLFDGPIGYAMFNEVDYHLLEGVDVCIVGHGAFAVENIRTCCEFGAMQIHLVCRRKNLACPRVCSWMANRSLNALQNARYMRATELMYDMIEMDPWSYHSVHANEKRTTCQITQKARFGIGDIYFLTIYMGKVKVHVDPAGVKRCSRHEVHLASGTKLPCQAILKLLGLVGEMDIDRLLKIKEMVGFWVNGDCRRYCVAEPLSVMCSQMGGTSFSPGAYQWSMEGIYFLDFPWDFESGPASSGMLPKHSADMSDEGTPRPAYVVDARHGTTTAMAVGMFTPGLAEVTQHNGFVKAVRHRLCHPIRKFIAQATEDWDHYAKIFLNQGFGTDKAYPTYPYTTKNVTEIYRQHMEETNEPALPCDADDLALCN